MVSMGQKLVLDIYCPILSFLIGLGTRGVRNLPLKVPFAGNQKAAAKETQDLSKRFWNCW